MASSCTRQSWTGYCCTQHQCVLCGLFSSTPDFPRWLLPSRVTSASTNTSWMPPYPPFFSSPLDGFSRLVNYVHIHDYPLRRPMIQRRTLEIKQRIPMTGPIEHPSSRHSTFLGTNDPRRVYQRSRAAAVVSAALIHTSSRTLSWSPSTPALEYHCRTDPLARVESNNRYCTLSLPSSNLGRTGPSE